MAASKTHHYDPQTNRRGFRNASDCGLAMRDGAAWSLDWDEVDCGSCLRYREMEIKRAAKALREAKLDVLRRDVESLLALSGFTAHVPAQPPPDGFPDVIATNGDTLLIAALDADGGDGVKSNPARMEWMNLLAPLQWKTESKVVVDVWTPDPASSARIRRLLRRAGEEKAKRDAEDRAHEKEARMRDYTKAIANDESWFSGRG